MLSLRLQCSDRLPRKNAPLEFDHRYMEEDIQRCYWLGLSLPVLPACRDGAAKLILARREHSMSADGSLTGQLLASSDRQASRGVHECDKVGNRSRQYR